MGSEEYNNLFNIDAVTFKKTDKEKIFYTKELKVSVKRLEQCFVEVSAESLFSEAEFKLKVWQTGDPIFAGFSKT